MTINDEQIKELEETGTMTFLKDVMLDGTQSVEFQREYQGLAELLGLSASQTLQIKITVYQGLYDAGYTYDYIITNNTGKAINAYYSLLFYHAQAYDEGEYGINWGHGFYTFHLTLKPNESVSGMLVTDSLLSQYDGSVLTASRRCGILSRIHLIKHKTLCSICFPSGYSHRSG